jgi:hypothetical protein
MNSTPATSNDHHGLAAPVSFNALLGHTPRLLA